MEERSIRVPEIHCEHCKHSLEGAVGAVQGVDEVRVDIEQRTVQVRYDGATADQSQIEAAIEAQGYEVQR